MARISDECLTFARSMSPLQWAVLRKLTEGVWPLSITERIDPELYVLVRRGLAACCCVVLATAERGLILPSWEATDSGRRLLEVYDTEGLG